jgi:hypothetical protein
VQSVPGSVEMDGSRRSGLTPSRKRKHYAERTIIEAGVVPCAHRRVRGVNDFRWVPVVGGSGVGM